MDKKEIEKIILKFGNEKSGYGKYHRGEGWLHRVRIGRTDNPIYVSFYYNYNEDPYGDTASSNAYFRGALLIDSEGKILAERLHYERKEWGAFGPSNFKDIDTFQALDRTLLIMKKKVREYINSKGCYSSSGLAYSLNKLIKKLLDKAIERANANNRKTVQEKDI